MIIHAKIQPNIPSVSREEVDFVIFVILVMAAILDIHPKTINPLSTGTETIHHANSMDPR